MRGTLTLGASVPSPPTPTLFLDVAERQGWGDGLPLIPPTADLVQAMFDGSAEPPAAVVGVVEPRRGEATIEKIAVNAVMAGCKPEYFPAVVAAVRAVCEPRFNLYALNTTTCCATPALMINGPARHALGIECGYSCLGHNGRANATIGRALRLVMRNVGGAIPGAVSKSTFGQPGRVSLCFGEWEEKSPWEPFHVRRGFQRDAERRHGALRDRHAGHRRHLGRDRRGADLGAGALDRLDRQQQGAGAAERRRDAAAALPRLRVQDRARRPVDRRTCSACCTS